MLSKTHKSAAKKKLNVYICSIVFQATDKFIYSTTTKW